MGEPEAVSADTTMVMAEAPHSDIKTIQRLAKSLKDEDVMAKRHKEGLAAAHRAVRMQQLRQWMSSANAEVSEELNTKYEHEKALKQWFKFIDTDGSGEISVAELQDPLLSLGLATSKAQVEALIASVDTNGSGEIGFEEFAQVMMAGAPDGQGNPIKKLYLAMAAGELGDTSLHMSVLIAAYRRRTIMQGLRAYSTPGKSPEKMKSLKYVRNLAQVQRLEEGAAAHGGAALTDVDEDPKPQVVTPKAESKPVKTRAQVLRSVTPGVMRKCQRREAANCRITAQSKDYDVFQMRRAPKPVRLVIDSGLPGLSSCLSAPTSPLEWTKYGLMEQHQHQQPATPATLPRVQSAKYHFSGSGRDKAAVPENVRVLRTVTPTPGSPLSHVTEILVPELDAPAAAAQRPETVPSHAKSLAIAREAAKQPQVEPTTAWEAASLGQGTGRWGYLTDPTAVQPQARLRPRKPKAPTATQPAAASTGSALAVNARSVGKTY